MRIVLLEDDEGFRESLEGILEGLGYEVYAFDNPSICPLQKIPQCRCGENERCTDVIITDLRMPFIDGLEFIKTQRAKNCKCQHVAIISGCIMEENLSEAKELNCKIFIKPFKINDLLKWLESIHISPDRKLRDWFKQPV